MRKSFQLKIRGVLLMLLPLLGSAQPTAFPRGIYTSYQSLRDGKPDRQDTLRIIPRKESEILWLGGNDYRLESDKKQFNGKHIYKYALAYVHNDSVFLNGRALNLESAFCLALTKGTYLAFYIYNEPQGTESVAAASVLFGAVGGLIAASAASENREKRRKLFVLSLNTGNAKRIGSYISLLAWKRTVPNCWNLMRKTLTKIRMR